MGMDISGINPKMRKSINEFPILEKWECISWGERKGKEWEEEQDQYWKEDKEYNKANSGIYFRNNCWWWRPLWHYCCVVGEDLIDEKTAIGCSYNDGNGLNDTDSMKLGILLLTKVEDGHTEHWKNERDLYLESLPDDNCGRCNNNNRGNDKKKECKSCDGKGTTENFEKHYPFEVENVRNFANFLLDSGGFEVW